MTATDLVDRLAAHKTLGSAPREELAWLASHGTLQSLSAGEVVTAKTEPVAAMLIVLTGHLAIFVDRGAGKHKVLEWRAGDVAGTLPYSRMVGAPGNAITLEASEVLSVPRSDFSALTRECPEVTAILVHKMVDRARVFTSSDLQDEKMISLGKLSAGLAHELNNPASAIERSATLLDKRVDDVERATRALNGHQLTESQLATLDVVRASCVTTEVHGTLSPIEQAEREDAITMWLTAHSIEGDLAGPLAETAVTIDGLDRMAAAVSGATLAAALRWLAAVCSIHVLTSEIQAAAMRIAGLVTAVKGFTRMDQAMVAEPVDLKSSIGNTVAVLNSKARSKSVAVSLYLPPDLPAVRGYAGELNQIWSNLIDNALDAVPESGRIEVTATRLGHRVIVRVVDNGPGIPVDIRNRIFDPFFTTKPVGKGTGLGLDIVRRLITHNDAEIDVESVPGRTEFRVSLPVDTNSEPASQP